MLDVCSCWMCCAVVVPFSGVRPVELDAQALGM
jgi:hypothetical protein